MKSLEKFFFHDGQSWKLFEIKELVNISQLAEIACFVRSLQFQGAFSIFLIEMTGRSLVLSISTPAIERGTHSNLKQV
jgi:hypothetical protein